MRARLPLEVEEQLKKKCFTLLCYHDPNSGECQNSCVLFAVGLQGSWAALLRTMYLNVRFGTETGKHWRH